MKKIPITNMLLVTAACCSLTMAVLSCGKKGGGSSSSNGTSGGPTGGGGGGGTPALAATLNLSGATGILAVDPSNKGSKLALVEKHNATAKKIGAPQLSLADVDFSTLDVERDSLGLANSSDTPDGTKSIQKTLSDGSVKAAMVTKTVDFPNSNCQGCQAPTPPPLPKVMTFAVSPAPYHELYVHFENPFRFKIPANGKETQGGPGVDPTGDGTYCQLFKVNDGTAGQSVTVASLSAKAPTAANLECIDPDHIIPQWNAGRFSVFQFDSSGNVYYPGQIRNSPKMVVYKRDRVSGALTEMINSNICVSDFLVTPSGGIFYTGTDSCQGGGGSPNGGFFRYVTSSQSLIEIARGWNGFIYETAVTASGADTAVFFGPDPTISSTASWNTANLFNFNPTGGSTTSARTTALLTSGSDIWSWINMSRKEDIKEFGVGFQNGNDATNAWKTEAIDRCTSSGQVFAGGGSQISRIAQDSTGQVYVIGNVRKKNAGTLTCGIQIRGPHCKIDGQPDPTYTTSAKCTTAQGTWVDDGNCNGPYSTSTDCFASQSNPTWNRKSDWYNGVTTAFCTKTGGITMANWWSADNTVSFQNATSSTANTMVFSVNNYNCQPPPSTSAGDQWTSEYIGLAAVDATTKTLSLLSDVNEQATNVWVINDKVYYSAFNSTTGQYLLRYWDGTQSNTMLSNFEVYNLSASPDSSTLLIDGLDFSDNSYTFGTILTASPYTLTAKTGLTGQLKAVYILPKS